MVRSHQEQQMTMLWSKVVVPLFFTAISSCPLFPSFLSDCLKYFSRITSKINDVDNLASQLCIFFLFIGSSTATKSRCRILSRLFMLYVISWFHLISFLHLLNTSCRNPFFNMIGPIMWSGENIISSSQPESKTQFPASQNKKGRLLCNHLSHHISRLLLQRTMVSVFWQKLASQHSFLSASPDMLKKCYFYLQVQYICAPVWLLF